MEKSVTNDCSINGNGKMQLERETDFAMSNGVKSETDIDEGKNGKISLPTCGEMDTRQKLDSQVPSKLRTDFINGSSNSVSACEMDNCNKDLKVNSVSSYVEIRKNVFSSEIASSNNLMKAERGLDGINISRKELESKITMKKEVEDEFHLSDSKDKEDVSCIWPVVVECDNKKTGLVNNKTGMSISFAKAVLPTEDDIILRNMTLDEQDDIKDADCNVDDTVLDLKTLSAEVERSGVDVRKLQKTKSPDSFRPFARLLHDLGQEIVRQMVYKDLIDIQVAKDAKNKLDDKDKSQLIKLTDAHMKLCTKNEVYHLPVSSCHCGFMSTSDNVMRLHREFGHSIDQYPHVCCYCDDFKSKWPSQFIAHLDTVHNVKARLQKKLAPNVCFFCPYEHKNWMKIELHMSKCANKFSLSGNLQPQPADCDIPVVYKPGHVQKTYSFIQPNLSTMTGGRFPVHSSNQVTSPLNVSAGQSSVMEIDGQLYSLVNHNGKVLLTSLRSQIGGSSTAGTNIPPTVNVSAGKVQFPMSSSMRSRPSPLEAAKQTAQGHRETCEICGSVMSSREALWTHFRDVHRVELSRTSMREQEPWMKCTVCNTRFWTYQGLARHSSTHHNRNVAPLPQTMNPSRLMRCFLCGNSQTSNPLNHFSTFHNITLLDMLQNRQCCMCNKRLKQSRAFEEHMIVQHRDIFANSDVLRTVIQALTTAYYLKTEDGYLQRPPLMVQQLQQNVSNSDVMSGAKMYSCTKGASAASAVRTIPSTSMATGMRMLADSNLVSGLKMVPGSNLTFGTKMMPSASPLSGAKSVSGLNMMFGTKVGASSLTSAKMSRGSKVVPVVNVVDGEEAAGTSVRIATGSLPTALTQSGAKNARSSDPKRSRARHDSADRRKMNEQSTSPASKMPAKKSREEDEKDFTKLYSQLSDIGRPVLRSMRHKLAEKQLCETVVQKQVDSDEGVRSGNSTEVNEKNMDGPEKKKLRLDPEAAVTFKANPSGAAVSEASMTFSGIETLATDVNSKAVQIV